jgi:hypothetical protein
MSALLNAYFEGVIALTRPDEIPAEFAFLQKQFLCGVKPARLPAGLLGTKTVESLEKVGASDVVARLPTLQGLLMCGDVLLPDGLNATSLNR